MTPPGWRITNRATQQSHDVYAKKALTAFEANVVAGPYIGIVPFSGVDCEPLPPKEAEPEPAPKRGRGAKKHK